MAAVDPRPPEGVADLFGNLGKPAIDRKGAVRCMDDAANQMRMSEDCHEERDGKSGADRIRANLRLS